MMIISSAGLGIDFSQLWNNVKTAAQELPGELYRKSVETVENKTVQAVQPTVQAQIEAKAQRVVNKGNVAMMAAAGGLAGVLIAGGNWQRRTVGGSVGAILGGLAGLQVGLAGDTTTR